MESEYKIWLIELKLKIRSAQVKAALAVNSSLTQLYWKIGKQLADNTFGSNFQRIYLLRSNNQTSI